MEKKNIICVMVMAAILLGGIFILKNNTVSVAATKINVNIGGKNFTATLEDNASAKAFAKHLPESFNMSELNGNEKYKYLDYELPADEKKVGTIHAGDIMLYGNDCIVIFYKSFITPYSYTRLGKLDDTKGLKNAVTDSDVKVSFSKKRSRKISLNKTALKLVKGKKYKLKLKNAKTAKVKWSSRNKKVAAVNKSGRVTAKKKGGTTVTATYGKKMYKCRVTVVDKKTADNTAEKSQSSDIVKQETDNNSTSQDTIKEGKDMVLLINDTEVEVLWEDNESVREIEKMAEDKDISIAMSGYGGFEQVGSLGTSITRNDVQMTTSSGDIVLYSGSNIVIFYGSNSWSYTKLGKVINKTDEELTKLLSGSDIVMTIKFK
ncbi:MAG: Ig-like domain-containing protein [Lachnospiraceae bacterium]|nr:Ig-like domain-containing protein [Lachnospiraceae bacterium]